jgi:AcrR family transcriptional regulator
MSSDLRRQILDTARQILIEQGYASLSLRRIASHIGCSATAIYLYFDNRDALVHSLIDEGFALLYDRMTKAGESTTNDGDAIARLRKIAWEYISFGLENPEYYEIMFMLNPKDLTRFPTEKYRRASKSMDPFIAELRAGISDGRFRPVNLRSYANVIWASLHGGTAIVLARRLDVRIDQRQFLRELVENSLAGIVQGRD